MTPFPQRRRPTETTRPFRWTIRRLALFLVAGALLSGCDVFGDEDTSQDAVYPMYVDENGNGINDYVEVSGHDSGPSTATRFSEGLSSGEMPKGPVPPGHAFVDENEDGICDYAQNGSATWHGPNFVDEDGDGQRDYWEPGGRGHGRHHHGRGGG